MITLAVDLGGSHATCAVLIDEQLREKQVLAIPGDRQRATFPRLLDQIAAQLRLLARKLQMETARADGLVLGFPGIVDATGTRVTATNEKFDEARGFDFDRWARKELGVRCVLENDARLALLGEHFCGAAAGFSDAALITLGTGIGAAAMLDGKALRGASGRAGCLGGHLPVQMHGRRCTCGNIGCAEAEASTWALRFIAQEIAGYAASPLSARQTLDFAFVFACADSGDAVARAVLDRCIAVWSALAVAMIHAYSPEVLLFGGGVMARREELLNPIRNHVTAYAWDAEGSILRSALLGSDAALYGAIPRLREVLL